jgi:hypothetical protein
LDPDSIESVDPDSIESVDPDPRSMRIKMTHKKSRKKLRNFMF